MGISIIACSMDDYENGLSFHKSGPIACTFHKDVGDASSLDPLCPNRRVFPKASGCAGIHFRCILDTADLYFSNCWRSSSCDHISHNGIPQNIACCLGKELSKRK